ncbi:MAG TPA: ABC transporter substrate-binding protein [Halanaerobiales bacterium]|nr:ABC transporter substrate-binding protein [Halanaerobiales bacterium]
MLRKTSSLLIVFLLAGLFLTVFSSSLVIAQEDVEVYKIGFVNHLTGDLALYGESKRNGIEIGVKKINEAGGINGTPVKVIYEDDRGEAAGAVTAARKLVESDDVPAIIGSGASSCTLAMLPICKEANTIVVSPASTHPSLREYTETYFGMMPTDEVQGRYLANFAHEREIDNVAVMVINNDYGVGNLETFKEYYEGNIVGSEIFNGGRTDYRSELLKIRSKDPEAIFLIAYAKEGGIILKQAREMGLEVPVYGDATLSTEAVIETAGDGSRNFYALVPGDPESPEYKQFEEDFMEQYGTRPTIWSDFAYDAFMLIAKGIEENGYSADGIREYLKNVEGYRGVSGIKTFDEAGIVTAAYSFYKVEDGEFVYWDWK